MKVLHKKIPLEIYQNKEQHDAPHQPFDLRVRSRVVHLFEALPYHRANDADAPYAQELDEHEVHERRKQNGETLLDFGDVPVVSDVKPSVLSERAVDGRQLFLQDVAAARPAVDDVRESKNNDGNKNEGGFKRMRAVKLSQAQIVNVPDFGNKLRRGAGH